MLMLPEEYVELAICTEPSAEDYIQCAERAKGLALFVEMMTFLHEAVELGERMNKFKRAIYYGSEIELADEDPTRTSAAATQISRVDSEFIRLLHSGMGLFTEAGEFIEALISYLENGDIDLINLGEELGDSCWYIAIGSSGVKIPLSKIMITNITKLEKRFGKKFNKKRALLRNLQDERKILDDMNK
jgi:NTP pyrophosphatase (non-canonical NTP hydrolase)